MKYKELKYKGKTYTNKKDIENILKENDFKWLFQCEFESAELEIKKDTLIWNSGDFNFGDWKYGIFKNGAFNGTFESGIFEPTEASFKGKWVDGIKFW